MNYLTRVDLNHDVPDLCLLSSRDYRDELPAHRCSVVEFMPTMCKALVLMPNAIKIHKNKD
jgi:hypothetical protein